MGLYFTSIYCVPQRSRVVCRWLSTDILPTLLLLLAMAFGMAWVAIYTDATHLNPVTSSDQVTVRVLR